LSFSKRQKTKVAITGATGFLGTALVNHLLSLDYELVALRRKPLTAVDPTEVSWVFGELDDLSALSRLMSGADILVHCAAVIKALNKNDFNRVNVLGTKAVMETANQCGVQRVINISSLAAKEPNLSFYCASKNDAEKYIVNQANVPETVNIRLPVVYGPGDLETLSFFKMASYGIVFVPEKTEISMSMIHIEDVTDAIEYCCKASKCSGMFEIDDGKLGGYNWAELAQIVGKSLGRSVRLVRLPKALFFGLGLLISLKAFLTRSPEMLMLSKIPEILHPDWLVSSEKLVGWEPQWKIQNGFKNTVKWYRPQNILKSYL
jgi:nucleoside-diphosphate-sugar epimerase